MKKRKQIALLLSLIFIFAIQSCAQNGVIINRNVEHVRAEFVVGPNKLAKKVFIEDVRFKKVGNFQRVEVALKNLSGIRFSLEYRIDWRDAEGFTINSNKVWHRITLGPNQTMNLGSVGKDPDAYRIHMTVRYADDLFIESNKQEKKDK